MIRNSSATAEQRALRLNIDRTFDAPRELVWRLWREPEHMVRWHGPEGVALIDCEIDFRVGGKWRRCMSAGGEHRHWIHGEYLEISEPSRLSFTYINDADGFETVVTMDFLETADGWTRMLFEQSPFIDEAERDGHGWGWNSSLKVFARYLLLFSDDDDWSPKGRPRRDGVAEDLAAARERDRVAKEDIRRAERAGDR